MQPPKNPDLSFYFVDPDHFRPKSWGSLYKFIELYKIPYYSETETGEWRKKFGRYEDFQSLFRDDLNMLRAMTYDELRSYSISGINIFSCVRGELLSYLLSLKEWYSGSIPHDNAALFKRMYATNHADLLLNMAAGCYWMRTWESKMPMLQNYTHAIMFSGSKIYSATLLNLLKTKNIVPLVAEHFFTGNDYYLESRYEPVANNSELKLDNIWNGYKAEIAGQDKNMMLESAMDKISGMKNKNVTQPKITNTYINFVNDNKTVLILGQVLNDFSVIETSEEDVNIIHLYKNLILGLLEKTDYNIVFKAHPWERKKLGENAEPVTIKELSKFRNEMPLEMADRIFLTEDYNIHSLFGKADFITTLCSQGAIEAAICGLKPFMFGKAFFGRRGFTHDCYSVSKACEAISSAKTGLLSLDEYKNLQDFLIIALEKHLINVNSGIGSLENRFGVVKIKENADIQKPEIPARQNKVIDKKELFKRRAKKLMRDPKAFLKDSKYKPLQKLHKYF